MKKYLLIIFLGLLITFPFIYNPSKDLFLFISSPFLSVLEKTGFVFSNFLEAISNIKNLAKENKKLEREIQKLQSEKSTLVEKEKENEVLKKQLGFIEENKGLNLIPADVIGRTPNSFMQYLILNRGKKDGLTEGQVVVYEKLLVGKIVEVDFSTSKVFLITNPTSVVPALTQSSRANGLVKGEVGYGLVLEDIPKEAGVVEGEEVVTSGLQEDFPKGLLLGQVEKITSTPSDLFQKASLKPLLDFSKLEIAFVIKKD